MSVYPIPPLPEGTNQMEPKLPTVMEPVDVLSASTDDIEIQAEIEKAEPEIEKAEPEIEEEEPEIEETPKMQELVAEEDEKTMTKTMTPVELLAIFLIFCLILLALCIMWDNLFTTLFICCITLPILKRMGKV